MITFAKRRWRLAATWMALAVFVLAVWWVGSTRLGRMAYLTGWVLLAAMFVLAAYNGRKKLPFLPLGTSEGWLQFHIYAGFFTVLLFLIHIRFQFPRGWFEGVLAWLYTLVTLSGVLGLVVSRTFPKRLTARGSEVIFERIPVVRRQLRERAEALVLRSVNEGQSTTLADFYTRHLDDFFAGNRNFAAHLLESRLPFTRLQERITDLGRYLNEAERGILLELEGLARQKDGLDYQHAMQLALKLWLFIHLPLTYCLLLWTAVHVVLVYAFSGGAE
jgi:hypothetical protein